ncbi:DnaB-like helicase N-terminal domain-containing protein [Mycolicibacterium sphagni]|nr:DnaB-like helicase N-terminal domain-containing protein [Mycolicibacterium sphagni]
MTAEPIAEEAAPAGGGTPRHLLPVGKPATIAELAIGALMYSSATEATAITQHLRADDFTEPAASTVFTALKLIADLGVPPGPELVADDLRRRGRWDRPVATWLSTATVSGACPPAARQYAAAVVADRLRRQVESLGTALRSAATSASEPELNHLVVTGTQRIQNTTERLTNLRGEPLDD